MLRDKLNRLRVLENNILRIAGLLVEATQSKNTRTMAFHFEELAEFNDRRIALLTEAVQS